MDALFLCTENFVVIGQWGWTFTSFGVKWFGHFLFH